MKRRIPVAALALALAVAVPGAAQDSPSLERARGLYDTGRLGEARAELQTLVRAGSRDPGVYLLLGVVERSDGRFGSAITWLRQAQRFDPVAVPIRVELATTLAWNRELGRAVDLYREVLREDPGNPGARIGLAFALAWLGRPGEARGLFRELTEEDPANVSAWLGLGTVERAAFRGAEAAEAYRRVLALDPGSLEAREALEELRWDRRTQVRVLAGGTTLSGSSGGAEIRAEAAYAVSARLTASGALQRYAFGAVSPVTGGSALNGTRTEYSVEAGVVYRPSDRATLAANLYAFSSEDAGRALLWLEGVTRVARRVSVVAGLRPTVSSVEPRSLLGGMAGATVSLSPSHEVGARALIGGNPEYEPRVTLLAHYDAAFSRQLLLRAGGAHAGGDRFGFTRVSAGATYLATPSVGVSTDLSRRSGTAERTTLVAGLVFRF